MLEIGSKAPEFSLPDQNGEVHTLSDYKGKKVILYFYPKDMTGGCTSQACNFRDRYPQIQEKSAVVLGVSKDGKSTKSLLRSTYLIDEDGMIVQAIGGVKPKENADQMLEMLG